MNIEQFSCICVGVTINVLTFVAGIAIGRAMKVDKSTD